MASCFMRPSSAAPIRPYVARVSGALINRTSAASRSSFSRSGAPIQSTRSSPEAMIACEWQRELFDVVQSGVVKININETHDITNRGRTI